MWDCFFSESFSDKLLLSCHEMSWFPNRFAKLKTEYKMIINLNILKKNIVLMWRDSNNVTQSTVC